MKRFILMAVSLSLVMASLQFTCSLMTATADEPGVPGLANVVIPVEEDMHEFMEYIFEPTYKRLKAAMAAEPADKAGWKPIKADSLILAEGANLLLNRASENDPAKWTKLTIAVRAAGGQLYQAAKKNDYPASRKAYELMLTNCNNCHMQFAEGEYQLAP